MAFKQKGWSPFKIDDKKTQTEIKTFIENNMDKMSDAELMKAVNEKSDGKTEYNWNVKTGEVEIKRNAPLKAFANGDKKEKEEKKNDNFMRNYRWLVETKQIPPVTKDNIGQFKEAIHDTKEV